MTSSWCFWSVHCDVHREVNLTHPYYFLLMTKTRPAAKLMQASAQCAELGAAYGNCVLATYNNMNKDSCKKEFDAFRSCVSKSLKRK